MKKLIIVESPSKSKTINSYVGKDYIVLSSKGHLRDLATSGPGGLGIDVENDFSPKYETIKGKGQIVKDIVAAAKNADQVYLATDPDREGEAISWHLSEILKLDENDNNRIVFREITKTAVLDALSHPRKIDKDLVNSQETRRMLDRIIGFKLSKLLQNKIHSQSAGRVQSVALKLIVDLEKEIEAFIPEEYYDITAHFDKFDAGYFIKDKRKIKKDEAEKIVKESTNPFTVKEVSKKESKRNAKLPFITSTMQQDAITNLNMSSARTMMIAQKLYEGIEIDGEIVGLITYMRTDSTRLANDFVTDAQNYITNTYGNEYLGTYKTSKKENSQDAHEAIRPSSVLRTPEIMKSFLDADEFKLYQRIYQRAVSSLMATALYDVTKVTLSTNSHDYQVEGAIQRFKGYQILYPDATKDKLLPELKVDQKLNANSISCERKETTPKARYSEATLIKEMESLGIGRPSTYSQTMQTLKKREYVEMIEKRFKPTPQGRLTSDQLDIFFNKVINVEYTSKMENDLDKIAEGQEKTYSVLKSFYDEFIPMVDTAWKDMKKPIAEETGEDCPLCGKPLVTRFSKYGEFVACSGFPSCKYIKKEEKKESDEEK